MHPLASGTHLGRYVLESLIGSGGMGHVYRAHDPLLERAVAIKTLIPGATDADQLRRFETEARMVGGLAHPNLLVVHDLGSHDGVAYLVSELLLGETLRDRLRRDGTVRVSQALEWSLDIARGLAAAHAIGIVHRDLKPENLFLARDHRVKILDFGIAKRVQLPEQPSASSDPSLTVTGAIIGTVGYMAPEQVLGEPVDARTDVFALGVVMYEMLTGSAPFRMESAIATMHAIAATPTPPLPSSVPRSLGSVVFRCLDKAPERRFQSAHDVAVALEVIANIPSDALQLSSGSRDATLSPSSSDAAPAPKALSRRTALVAGASGLALLAAGGAAGTWFAGSRSDLVPTYRRLTFRRGLIRGVRYSPDGQSVLYSALWDGDPSRVFTARLDSGDTGSIELPDANLLAVSKTGELALALGRHSLNVFTYGTLARVPITGGSPRALLDGVKFADWSPDGTTLAIVRHVGGRDRLEYPIGTVLLDPPAGSASGLGFVRVSPDGDSVAYVRYRDPQSLIGYAAVIGRDGKERRLSPEYVNAHGLTWRGDNLLLTASDDRPLFRSIRVVRMNGRVDVLSRLPANVSVWDANRDGAILLSQVDDRAMLMYRRLNEAIDRDLSLLDASRCADLSRDGTRLLFTELGAGSAGGHGTIYLRGTDGSPAIRLASGVAYALSPDQQWALCGDPDIPGGAPTPRLLMVPTGAGETRVVAGGGRLIRRARYLPDGQRAVVEVSSEQGEAKLEVLDLASGAFRSLTDGGVTTWGIAPDGSAVAVSRLGRSPELVNLQSRATRPLLGSAMSDNVVEWIDSGILVTQRDETAASLGRVQRLDPNTGARSEFANLLPRDAAGLMVRLEISVTPDGKHCAFSWHRALGTIYEAKSLA